MLELVWRRIKVLRVVRKAHRRKSYLKRGKLVSGGLVSRSKAFLIKDRGRRGRGEDFLHGKELKHGSLGEGFFDKSRATQERILSGKVKQFGEKSVVGKLHFLSVVQKR